MHASLRNSLIVSGLGTPGTVERGKGTLVCDTAGSASTNSVIVDMPVVELDERGNAQFGCSVGPLPDACVAGLPTAFLIRTESGRWAANGGVAR